jgi:prepilin-type N-terminal cleavage/methylation domain-containing protein
MRPSSRASAGFTIIELLISLVIIGIISAAVAPSLSEVLSDNRQVAATQNIVRLARRARSLALASGLAHLLRYQAWSSCSRA